MTAPRVDKPGSDVEPGDLPVLHALPALQAALAGPGVAVLVAPPGSGKTTRVPLALLTAAWLGGRRIVMLEPRRLAARAAAAYMASLLSEKVGATVGYRVRADTRVSAHTRIEVVTEGVLTRMLQGDPSLDGVGCVIFDEFHERSVHADLGLALCIRSRALLREDLRLLVMSATLDAQPVATLLGEAPVVRAEGRTFPVETHYGSQPGSDRIDSTAASAVRRALDAHAGDVLVFLPGAGEIRATERHLRDASLPNTVDVFSLFGALPLAEQDRAIRPSPAGRRKVVLSTSIAETSLTIEGVRVVIDSGLARVPRFSARTGLVQLATTRVSRASADQRRGRAGRVAPGVCYRLWTEGEHAALLDRTVPEILEADLTPLALELAVWGEPADALAWLDPPPSSALAQAAELLREMEALDGAGRVTEHGRAIAPLGVHPRLAHMLVRGRELGAAGPACDLAALLSERDVLRSREGPPDPDVRLRTDALLALRAGKRVAPGIDVGALRRVRTEGDRLRRRFGDAGDGDPDATGRLLALAYPDRVALRRDARGRFVMRTGRGATVPPEWALAGSDALAIANVDDRGRDGRIVLAAPIPPGMLGVLFAAQVECTDIVDWDDAAGAVIAVRRDTLGALVLRERAAADPDPGRVTAALLQGIARRGLDALPWTKESRRFLERIRFAATVEPDWPDASDDALLHSLDVWLAPFLSGMRRLSDLRALDLIVVLGAWIGWDRRRRLDEIAPSHVEVPTGSRIAVDYSDASAPVLAVRLQEMFGLAEGPAVGDGRVPLTLHLLSPAHRPLQVTRDLAGFWKGSYHEVRKEMRGRYPKHPWPEDPLNAEPTRRTKKKAN